MRVCTTVRSFYGLHSTAATVRAYTCHHSVPNFIRHLSGETSASSARKSEVRIEDISDVSEGRAVYKHDDQEFQMIHILREHLMRGQRLNIEEAFVEMERLIDEYRYADNFEDTDLFKLSPRLNRYTYFHTQIPLLNAFRWYDNRFRFAQRRYVGPSDDELRHVFNVAQIMPMAPTLRLASFDGDNTIYENRHRLEAGSPIVTQIVRLLQRGVSIALTTAVGSADAEPYEDRLTGLLDVLASSARRDRDSDEDEDEDEDSANDAPPPLILGRDRGGAELLVVGGQCNYLYHLDPATLRLMPVEGDAWKTDEMRGWDLEIAKQMLATAHTTLQETSARLRMPMRFVTKSFATGALYCGPVNSSTQLYLDELALETRETLNRINFPVPFCCFNGGLDVFVDLGSKQHGITALQEYLGVSAAQTLHFGDQFGLTGNDLLARRVSPCIWVRDPNDTRTHLAWLLGFYKKLDRYRQQRKRADVDLKIYR